MFRWLNDGLRGKAELFLSGQECRFSPPRGPSATLPCVTTIDGDDAGHGAQLARAFEAARAQWGRRAVDVHVRLGSALVYQDAVRVDTATLSRDALHSLLSTHWHAALADAHGRLAISYSVQSGARSVVTSCTGEALVQRLRDAASGQGWRVASLAPYSAGVWNAHRNSVADRSGYLVVCEQDFVTIGAFQDGAWSAWAGEARAGDGWAELASSVQRFARCRGLDEALPVWVHRGVDSSTDPAAAGLHHWQVLETDLPAPRGALKMPSLRRRGPLELDFLRPGASTAHRPAQLALLAGSIPLFALAIAGYEQEARLVREQQAALELTAPRPHQRAANAGLSAAQLRSRAASAAQVKAIQAELSYPWQSALALLESARQEDVALLALEPDRRSGMTKISAEAASMTAMLNYLQELQKSGAFEDVVLTSHEIQARRPGTPVRFDLQAQWHAGFRLLRQPALDAAPAQQPSAATATATAAALLPTAVATTAAGR